MMIETGMRRFGVANCDLSGVDFKNKEITTVEKGGHQHTYAISKEGLQAVNDYLENERTDDVEYFSHSPALFLPAKEKTVSKGRLSVLSISNIWKEIAAAAKVDKSPHASRHGMGKRLIEKTQNVEAVQRQLSLLRPRLVLLSKRECRLGCCQRLSASVY